MGQYQQRWSQYHNGRYALVDYYYRNIWFVVNDEAIAHQIKKTFVSKISFIVVDLSNFENFNSEQETIDTNVCFAWQIPLVKNLDRACYSLLVDFDVTRTADDFVSKLLINCPAKTMLTQQTQLEVQDQIFLYLQVQENLILYDQLLNRQLHRSTANLYVIDPYQQEIFFSIIDSIFATELTLEDIEKCLCQLAVDHLGQTAVGPVTLLKLLNHTIYA